MRDNKDKILIVVAARKNSKGLKNKNIKELCGKPLISYAIRQAVKWGKADHIICSTDSREIARIAKQYGAEVPFMRPSGLSGDNVAKMEVIRHALLKCERIYKKVFNIIVDLDVTSPVRKVADLDKCLKLFRKNRPNVIFSVVKSRKNPYFNMVEIRKDGRVSLCKRLSRAVTSRQSAPCVYDVNASIYFYDRNYLMDKDNVTVISGDSMAYIMDGVSSLDIDKELDFKFVEFLAKEGTWKDEI